MKKYIILTLLLLASFGLSNTVKATSGACSSHGGVNCGIKNYNGSAICNDSFVSSTLYSNTDECKVPPKQCDYPIAPSCNLSAIEQQKQNAIGSQTAINARRGMAGSDFGSANIDSINSTYDLQYSACQSQLTAYQSQITQYNLCLNSQTNATNVVAIPPPPQNCGPNAIPTSDGLCSCQTGYKKLTNQCVTLAEYCPSMDGPGAIPSSNGNGFGEIDNECTCAPGYTKTDYVFARCLPIVQPQTSTQTDLGNIFGTTTKTSLPPVHKLKPKLSPSLDNIFATTSASSTASIRSTTTSTVTSTTTQPKPQVKQSFVARVWRFITSLFY